jgi:hypothetical protein
MTLEVIGAGFGRTGTMSLKVALEELGFGPCYHMIEVFENPEHVKLWEAAAKGEPVDWEELFRDYRATVDWPGAAFYEELMERYPDAKVILTVRDPDRWYESVLNTIYGRRRTDSSSPMSSLMELLVPRMRHMKRAAHMISNLTWEGVFGGKFEDRQYAIGVFNRLNEDVKERVPAERLLVYDVKEGWEPLCEFLGVEVPEGKPFPHLNDTEAFRAMVRQRERMGMVLTFAVLIGGASLAALALLYLFSATSRRTSARA